MDLTCIIDGVFAAPSEQPNSTGTSGPADYRRIFEDEFHPQNGRFADNDLRRRFYAAVAPNLTGADVYDMILKVLAATFTNEERLHILKHFVAATNKAEEQG